MSGALRSQNVLRLSAVDVGKKRCDTVFAHPLIIIKCLAGTVAARHRAVFLIDNYRHPVAALFSSTDFRPHFGDGQIMLQVNIIRKIQHAPCLI